MNTAAISHLSAISPRLCAVVMTCAGARWLQSAPGVLARLWQDDLREVQ